MYRFGPFEIDVAQGLLTREGAPVAAQPRAVALIGFLAERAGQVVSREALLEGVWPGVHVSDDALHQMLRRARAALGDDPAAPRYVETVHRRGWRFVAPVERVAPAAARADWVGREAMCAAVLAELRARPGWVTLHGPGGVGKTRLAAALALGWPGPARALELHALRDGDGVVGALAASLRIQAGDVPISGLASLIRAELDALGEALLVLDNAEHLAPGWAEALAHALGPRLRVLVTSRHRLGLDGERVVEVPPLDPAAAARLWRALTGEAGDDPAIPSLLARLDHLPLAIHLTAARARLLSPAELLRRAEQDLGRLAARPGAGRHDSLEAAVGVSWALLPEAGREDLARLSVIEGEFGLPEAEALLGPDALSRLERLADAALVSVERGRLRLLEGVRQHAARHGAAAAAMSAWIRFLRAELAERYARYDRLGDGATLAAMVARLPVVRRVLERPDLEPEARAQLAGLAARVASLSGPARQALPWLDAALAELGRLSSESAVELLSHASWVLNTTGDIDRSLALAEAARARLPADAPFDRRCRVESWWWGQASLRGRAAEAAEALAPWVAEAELQGSRLTAIHALAQRAAACSRAGQLAASEAALRRAVQLAEQEEAAHLLAWVQYNLAQLLTARGAGFEAEDLLLRVLDASRVQGRPGREAQALVQLAQLHLDAGRPARAREAAQAALARGTQLRSAFVISVAVPILGAVAMAEGDLAEARARLTAALVEHASCRDARYRALVLGLLALLSLVAGDEARPLIEEARAILPAQGHEELRLPAELAAAVLGLGALPATVPPKAVWGWSVEAACALVALQRDPAAAPQAAAALARLRAAELPAPPPAARWAEVAALTRLLERALARLSS